MKTVRVKSIKRLKNMGKVINLNVLKNHTFITGNGIVTHNCDSVQPALRSFLEEYSSNCGFIFTCNYKAKIIAPLQSRCSVIDFSFTKDEKLEMAAKFIHRMAHILTKENIEYDKKVLAELAMRFIPDWRRVLNELQRYSSSGVIDSGILANSGDASFNHLVKMVKEKEFTNVRKWLSANPDMDNSTLVRSFYDRAYDLVKSDSIPSLILILGEYQYKNAFVVDQEINNMCMLAEVMSNVEWK